MKKGELSHLAQPGAEIAVRVTPKASRNAVSDTPEGLKVSVTTVPEDGKATKAVVKLLANALGWVAAPADRSLRANPAPRRHHAIAKSTA
ncbi:MAG: DUF167 domain-containing protein [Maritimibacter sp.]